VRGLLLLSFALCLPLAAQDAARRVGFYQWVGVAPPDDRDLLTAARERSAGLGLGAFRFYLGARFDYRNPYLSPRRFQREPREGQEELRNGLTPAAILQLPRYAAVLDDPRLSTIVLTVYETRDYGGGYDDINLLRPWTAAEAAVERNEMGELCELLYKRWGHLPKTVILANHEADEKLMEILQHSGGDIALARNNLVEWTRARHSAVERARARHPSTALKIFTAFEISVVNLRIARTAGRFRKTNIASGYTALEEVVPYIETDLISYSAYESVNSPYQTREPDAPEQIVARLRRDLDHIRNAARGSISAAGRRRFGQNFVFIGELGFPREKFEPLPSGGVLPRLKTAIETALDWGAPYVILWQAFDAPRLGAEGWGYGAFDSQGNAPSLQPTAPGCSSIAECLPIWLDR
jgi:hypothetical protein